MSGTALAALAPLTTLRVGGPAARLLTAASEDELVEAVRAADASGEPLLVLGGGSNVVIADTGFAGTVVRVAARGRAWRPDGRHVQVEVQAGEPWDEVVTACIAEGLSGVEALSGIPGLTGATPMQNVGAYGQDISQTLHEVRVYDRARGQIVTLRPTDLRLGYRTSALRGGDRQVVLSVTLRLARDPSSAPLRYAELARALGVDVGGRAPLAEVRDAVLALRRGKGMVLDPADPDSVSAGSFFTNPILDAAQFETLRRRARERLGEERTPPEFPEARGSVKTSAAWLIEQAGFRRGYGDGRVGLSHKHTLAIVNRGGATAEEVLALAHAIAGGVDDAFGVRLTPEPVLVGLSW